MVQSCRPIEVFPIYIRAVQVRRITDVTPRMRRITLGGEGLRAHMADSGYPVGDFRSDGFDDEFKLILTHPDREEPLLPVQGDGHLIWPHDPQLVSRTYTVRRADLEAGEVDVDIVRHDVGMAAAWVDQVQVGDQVHIAGPKSSSGHPVNVDWTLIAGDETALPAIGRWLESWPAGTKAQVVIEIANDAERQDLPVPEGVQLTWVSRADAPAGTTTVLFDAIQALEWWPGQAFAWVAGEATTLTPIRRWLKHERGLGREYLDVTGYWKRSQVVTAPNNPAVPVDTAEADLEDAIDALTNLTPGFAVRVGLTVGLFHALETGPQTVADLAASTGAHPAGITKLTAYLAALDLLESDGERYGLTEMGELLADDYLEEIGSFDRPIANQELVGLLALTAAVRTGTGDVARWTALTHSPTLISAQVAAAEDDARYYATTLAGAAPVGTYQSLLMVGDGSVPVAHALVDAHPNLQVAILASPQALAVMTLEHPRITGVVGSPLALPADHDAVLIIDGVDKMADANARHLFSHTDLPVLVYTPVANEDEEDDVDDLGLGLIEFALGWPGERTDAQLRALFASAGRKVRDRISVGWGSMLYELVK